MAKILIWYLSCRWGECNESPWRVARRKSLRAVMTSLAVGVPLTIVTVLGLLLNGYILVVVVLTKQVHTLRFCLLLPMLCNFLLFLLRFSFFLSFLPPLVPFFLFILFFFNLQEGIYKTWKDRWISTVTVNYSPHLSFYTGASISRDII